MPDGKFACDTASGAGGLICHTYGQANTVPAEPVNFRTNANVPCVVGVPVIASTSGRNGLMIVIPGGMEPEATER